MERRSMSNRILKSRLARLEDRFNVERKGVAWLNPDKSVLFEGKEFTDMAEFEKAWRGAGYTEMILVTWNLDIPNKGNVFRCGETSEH
jgi:hypothetical protein